MSFNDAQDKIPALKGLRVAETPKQKDGVNYLKQSTQEGGQGLPFYERIRLEAKQKQEAAKKAGTGKSLEERLGMVRTQ